MAKGSRVSIKAFEKAMEACGPQKTTIEWNGLEIEIKKTIPLQMMLAFENNAADGCFEKDTGRFLPELKDFMIGLCTIIYYTNIGIPQSVDSKYKMVYETDIVDRIAEQVNETQYAELCEAVDRKISYMAASRIEEINRQINGLSDTITELSDKIKSMFDGITEDDVRNVMGAFANGGFSEEKLMKAYLEQKREPDIAEAETGG